MGANVAKKFETTKSEQADMTNCVRTQWQNLTLAIS